MDRMHDDADLDQDDAPQRQSEADIRAAMLRSLEDIEAGRTSDAAEALTRLRQLADRSKARIAARGKADA